jgi:hypothetical protein
MTSSDYIIDIALIGVVLLQIRGRRLTTTALLVPLAIVAYVAFKYLRGIPTAGNDLVLVAGCAAVGIVLGSLSGRFTSVYPGSDGLPMAKAGLIAAGLWILGTAGRLAFQLYATHGGGPAIDRFSATHSITTLTAWTSALVLMALCEALCRTGILAWRGSAIRRQAPESAAPAAAGPGGSIGGLSGVHDGDR